MPELAEVEFYRRQWAPKTGASIRRVRTHPKARIFREIPAGTVARALKGAAFLAAEAHGKQLCFRFSTGCLGIHLGMAGRLLATHPEMVPDRHDHLVLYTDDAALVFSDYRMFGKIRFHKGRTPPEWWSNLPPQPQDPAFDRGRFRILLRRFPRRPLKARLLDQDAFPGIGNWMADEILWRARIHPSAVPASLSPYKQRRLFESIKAVCRDALEVIATDWSTPPDTWLFNHRWKRGGTCPASGKPLLHETIGGRTTCFSPAIQKLE